MSVIKDLIEGLVPVDQRLPLMAPELFGILDGLPVGLLVAHFQQVIWNDRHKGEWNTLILDGDLRRTPF